MISKICELLKSIFQKKKFTSKFHKQMLVCKKYFKFKILFLR